MADCQILLNPGPCNCQTEPCDACDGYALMVCNCNSIRDDNFNVYVNGRYLGTIDNSSDACTGMFAVTNANITADGFPITDLFQCRSPDFFTPGCLGSPGIDCSSEALICQSCLDINADGVRSCCRDLAAVVVDIATFGPAPCSVLLKSTTPNGKGNFGLVRLGCMKDMGDDVWELDHYLIETNYQGGDNSSFHYPIAQPSDCCPCQVCFNLWDCSTSSGLDGAVFTAVANGEEVSCTTDSTGSCCVSPLVLHNLDDVSWSATYTSATRGVTTISGGFKAVCPGDNPIRRIDTGTNTVTFRIDDACSDPIVPCGGGTLTFEGSTYTADDDGLVVLHDVLGGEFTVSAECGGQDKSFVIEIGCGAAQLIVLQVPCGNCNAFVTVRGCNGEPLPGAEVLFTFEGRQRGGVTDENGQILATGIPNGPTCELDVTCARFDPHHETVNTSECVDATLGFDITLTPAAGYTCLSCGVIPLHNSISISDPYYGGPTTLSHGGSGWTGTITGTYYTDSCCPTKSVKVDYTFTASCALQVRVHIDSLRPGCPGTNTPTTSPNPITATSVIVPADCSLAPGFFFEFHAPASACGTADDIMYPTAPTWQILEL